MVERVVVIGAGIGGLVAALELAVNGCEVTLLEKERAAGGKMRLVEAGGRFIDAGPTVFTMKWVFEEIFARAGSSLTEAVTLKPLEILARHAWTAEERLDLFADLAQSADAIGRFAGSAEAQGYLRFSERAKSTYDALKSSYILAANPTPLSLAAGAGLKGIGDLWRIQPFVTLWKALGEYFRDIRLRQLFGRYATYCGSSPFESPATLMLVAHVEREGVWAIEGGMHKLAEALANAAIRHGAQIRYRAEVKDILARNGRASGVVLASGETLECDAIIANADVAAVASGAFGHSASHAIKASPGTRSLSAMTWAMTTPASGFPLVRHNVFFSDNYQAEFDDIFKRRRMPSTPTVYVCAEDRGDDGREINGPERLFALVNAPAIGDTHAFDTTETQRCQERAFGLLERCGLVIKTAPETTVMTTPNDFARLFPATGGALYGQASHGWAASFTRPTAKTRIPALYVAGGSAHPGPGVPMAAISGRSAAARVLYDIRSTRPSGWTATSGGISTR